MGSGSIELVAQAVSVVAALEDLGGLVAGTAARRAGARIDRDVRMSCREGSAQGALNRSASRNQPPCVVPRGMYQLAYT